MLLWHYCWWCFFDALLEILVVHGKGLRQSIEPFQKFYGVSEGDDQPARAEVYALGQVGESRGNRRGRNPDVGRAQPGHFASEYLPDALPAADGPLSVCTRGNPAQAADQLLAFDQESTARLVAAKGGHDPDRLTPPDSEEFLQTMPVQHGQGSRLQDSEDLRNALIPRRLIRHWQLWEVYRISIC